ncbi:hypothetical protein R1flu_023446 [Riccia fluitans]|uniref:ATP-dependent DNA helicase PIF1 n=1 Tax=Riccia fluitans TaxID=41844 RepID=A0ABD1XS33_9MARC
MKLNRRCVFASLLFGFFIGWFLREGRVLSIVLLFLLSHLMLGDVVSPSGRLRLSRCRAFPCEEETASDKQVGKEGMGELIILDDDDDFQETPTPSKMTLTQEQRSRIAQQKELALSRRMARENSQKLFEGSATPSQSLSTGKPDVGKVAVAGGGSIETPGSASGLKRGKTFSDEQIDELAAEHGWVSVRKRPVPGTSFGQGTSLRGWSPGMGSAMDSNLSSATEAAAKEAEKPKVEVQPPKSDWQKPKKKIKLSKQQLKVLKAISMGDSVFLTGSAGTGKSFVLEFAIRVLKAKYGASAVFVTASTGLAACALGGTTVHAFAGIGLGVGSKESLADKVKSRKDSRMRWQAAKALIVDEISMIDGELFDKLDYIGRIVRNNPRPFGGLQLIVTGDFYQLPPVNPETPNKYFAFDADCWNRCFHLQMELQHVFRQSDQDFVGLLNEIRRGGCSSENEVTLRSCTGPVDQSSGIVLTRLYPRKVDVSRENEQNLRALNQPTVMFIAKDEARNDFAKRQLDNVRVEAIIALCVGAQVMLAKNLDSSVGLVNGARGVVVGFCTPDDPRASEMNKAHISVSPSGVWPLVRFACDNVERFVAPESWSVLDGEVEVAKRTQVPLSLAWALSVHKCQGMTLDRVETDLSRAFDYGMVYVALSRVKSLQGLRLIGFDPTKIRVHPKVARFYEELESANASQEEANFEEADWK